MATNKNDDYILEENYHGDVKLIRNNSKKVDLSKPTDTLEHKSKQQEMMPTIYSNKNPLKKINHSNEKICLTKPKDLPNENTINTEYRSDTKVPIRYTIDKSEPTESIFKEMFSKLKVLFVAFAIFIGFVSLCVSLGSILSYDISHCIMIFIITEIVLLIMLSIIISPIMLILSLVCLVKSINRYNTNDININDIVKSIILLIASFIGVCVILRGIII